MAAIRAHRTGEGFIEDGPPLTRTGIFICRDPATGKQRRDWCPPDEILHAGSLASYRGKPVNVQVCETRAA